jgi:hypothetical protein
MPSACETPRIGVTSITTPSVTERPAKSCPPLRTATGRPERCAYASASATSPGEPHSTCASGSTAAKRGITAAAP